MTPAQQETLQLLAYGVPQVLETALALERLLLIQRTQMSPAQWADVLHHWQDTVRRSIATEDDVPTDTWELMQQYLFPLLKT